MNLSSKIKKFARRARKIFFFAPSKYFLGAPISLLAPGAKNPSYAPADNLVKHQTIALYDNTHSVRSAQ